MASASLLVVLLHLSVLAASDVLSPRPLGDGTRNHSKVIIVGAGAAGHAAAARLMENGLCDLIILEAEGRVGGRIHTISFGENIVDLGAEWVHGEAGNALYALAEPLGLLAHNNWQSLNTSNMRFVRSGGAEADPEDAALLYRLAELAHDDLDQMTNASGSVGELFLQRFNQRLLKSDRQPPTDLVNLFLIWYEKAVAFSDGVSWFNVSNKESYETLPGEPALPWKRNGMKTALDLLTKRYPNPAQELPVRQRVLLDSEVRTIRWGERVRGAPAPPLEEAVSTQAATKAAAAIVVELSNGGRHSADMVLVTVSLGVLKDRADTLFDPPLPRRKAETIRSLGFGQVDKLFLHFSTPWWPTSLSGFSLLVTEEDLEAFRRKYPEYGASGHWVHGLSGFYLDGHKPNVVLMDWIVGEAARAMERYSDQEIMLGCQRWLDVFLGRNYSIPLPTGFARSAWWSNPHFRGSYSYRSLDADRADVWPSQLAEPIVDDQSSPALMFAGEATSERHYSTVHGAIETGWREADRILRALKHTPANCTA